VPGNIRSWKKPFSTEKKPPKKSLEKIKVLHLITLLEFGGAQGNTIHTVENLDPHFFETHLWAGKGAYWDTDVLKSLGGSGRLRFFRSLVRELNPLLDFLALVTLFRAIKRLQPTILHTHSSKAGILGRLAGRLAGVPILVHTFHGFGFNDRQKPWTRRLFVSLERWIAPWTTKLIFVSESNIETAKRTKIGRESQYELIRSGVPLNKLRATALTTDPSALREELGISAESTLVTTIGAFKPQKNLDDFLLFAKQVRSLVPTTTFLIIGDGALRPALQRKTKELDLEKHVLMPGWRRDVPEILSISDVFVLTSLWEGLPRALVEAMALGVPPVCYRTDGINDLLEGNEKLLVNQGDIGDMTQKVVELFKNREQRAMISDLVRKKITTAFDIDVMVDQQHRLYLQLIDNHRRIN
jgi:glycosyltransferase involved in cell wall biosynthesis